MFKSLLLVGGQLASLVSNELDLFLREIDHLADHGIEQAGLTRANFTNDDGELAFLDLEVDIL